MFETRADLSAPCRLFGRPFRHFCFPRVIFPEQDHPTSLFFIDIDISDEEELPGTRVAIQWCQANLGSLKEVSMGTTLAITPQHSIELADPRWASIHNTDRCPRCSGLMVAEWCQDLSDHRAQRCVQCGEVIDPVILQNRLQYGMTIGPGKE